MPVEPWEGLLLIRRLLALAFFIPSVWLGAVGVGPWLQDPHAFATDVGLIVCGGGCLVGLAIAGSLAFSGPTWREAQESGYLSERARVPYLVTVMLSFCAAFVFIGARGVSRGVVPAIGDGPDVAFAASPLRFALVVGFWCGFGLLAAWGAWCVVRYERRKAAAGVDGGEASKRG
jgi:hypothetical protein